MDNIYKEIDSLFKLDIYQIRNDKDACKLKIASCLDAINDDEYNALHLKLNLILLQICDESELEKQKANFDN